MISKKKGKIRLGNITRVTSIINGKLSSKDLPVKEGLQIEYDYDGQEHYIVVTFIKYGEDGAVLEDICNRILELPAEEFDNFKAAWPTPETRRPRPSAARTPKGGLAAWRGDRQDTRRTAQGPSDSLFRESGVRKRETPGQA